MRMLQFLYTISSFNIFTIMELPLKFTFAVLLKHMRPVFGHVLVTSYFLLVFPINAGTFLLPLYFVCGTCSSVKVCLYKALTPMLAVSFKHKFGYS